MGGSEYYVVLVEDRHADPDVHLFSNEQEAVEHARNWAHEYAYDPDDVTEHDVSRRTDGCVYYVSYSPESDRVSVYRRRVDGAITADPNRPVADEQLSGEVPFDA